MWRGPKTRNGLEGDEDRDQREDALIEVDFNKVLFEIYLKEGETVIEGEEKPLRLIESGKIRLGGRTFLELWLDYQVNKENSILEGLYWTQKITYLDFFGLILRNPHGRRYVLSLSR
mgnify:FL=1